MIHRADSIVRPELSLFWTEAPWDSAVTGCGVWQINRLILGTGNPDLGMRDFAAARYLANVGMVSCRLPSHCLRESMLLEESAFRYVETVLSPCLELPGDSLEEASVSVTVQPAGQSDLPFVLATAETSFSHERFHADPRLGPALGNLRYRNWAQSAFDHPSQRLFVLWDDAKPVSFFVTEMQEDATCYWHLTAVAPAYQGHGYGVKCWRAMVGAAAIAGAKRIVTTVVARNTRVLNLYARLGFRFQDPRMTFHWIRAV